MAAQGLVSQFPLERRRRDGHRCRSCARLPRIIARVLPHGRSGRRRRARRRRHHRQPRVHPPDRQAHPQTRARRSPSSTMSRRACGPGARAGRARCARYVDHVLALLPFEPAGARAARRPALHLCRPSADRAAAMDAALDPRRWPSACGCEPTRRCPRRAAGQPHLRGAAPDGAVRRGRRAARRARRSFEVIIPVVPRVRPLIEEHLHVVAASGRISSRARRTSSAPSSWHTRRWPPPAR